MPKILTRDERRERTRTGLIDAAERLFVRTGFHATSVDAVAAVAGYTKGAVYSTQRLAERLAGLGVRDPRVEVEPVEQLERSAGGKLQVVVAEREVRSPKLDRYRAVGDPPVRDRDEGTAQVVR